MLEHARRVSFRERFEMNIGESSKTALEFWINSNFEISKVGVVSTKEKIHSFKHSGWTKDGVEFKKRVFFYRR